MAQGLFQRLEWMKLSPRRILEAGCGVGADLAALTRRYPEAQVLGIDLAQSFLQSGREVGQSAALVCADTLSLPLAKQSVDFIYANLLLPWCPNIVPVLKEWRRILRPQGLLLFSCLGPDSFKEWRDSKGAAFLPGLIDMHEIGDLLLATGFADPVLEVEDITLTYRSQKQLQDELEKSGMQQSGHPLNDLSFPDNIYPVTFEVIYAHAWCPAETGFAADKQGTVKIPVSQLKG